jgi:hypothetical protein
MHVAYAEIAFSEVIMKWSNYVATNSSYTIHSSYIHQKNCADGPDI